jgi:putrescine transport system ATP-binding protein
MAIQRQLGITFVMVTHDQEEAMAMATRIAVMDGGRIMQVGSPQDIYEAPRSRFVADFIGSVNLLEGSVTGSRGGEAVMDCPSLGTRVVFATARAIPAGESAALALRPERIAIGEAPGAANAVSGRIAALAYHGGASVLRVALATGTVLQVTKPNLVENSAGLLAIGSPVTLFWSPQATTLIEP